MPNIADGSYPLSTAPDADDWIILVQDGVVTRMPYSQLRAWLGVDGSQDIVFQEGVGIVLTAPNGNTYKVTVSNAGGLLLTGTGTANGGFATGTVLSTPLSTDFNLINSVVPGGYVRSDYTWATVQPTNASTWSWATYDARIDAVHSAGLKVLAMLGYTPAWANGGNADDKYPPAAGFEDEFQEFCHQFALRYIPEGVTVFELWNEPNLDRFWKPVPHVYNYVNRVLIPGSNGLRAAAASLGVNITIITAGTAPASSGTVTQRTVINKVLTSNVATLTTSVNHGYTVGKTIDVQGVDPTFDGAYTITATPAANTVSYAKVAPNVASTADSGNVYSGTGNNIDPRMFAHALYGNGGRNYFDAIGHHPYTWPWPPNQDESIAIGSYNPNQWNTMVQTKRIREIMVAYGDSAKKIWATEVGAPSRNTAPFHPTSTNFISHATLATRIGQIFDYWHGMPTVGDPGWAGPILWYQHRNQSSEPLSDANTEGGFGMRYNDGSAKPDGVEAALAAKFAQYA